MQEYLKEVVDSLQEKFPLPTQDILECLEETMAEVLTERYKMPIVVFFDEKDMNLDIMAYVNNAGVCEEHHIPLEKVRGFNTIKRRIERNLQKREMFHDFEVAKKVEGDVLWGELTQIDRNDGTLYVMVELHNGDTMLAICDKRYQPPHERRHYNLGDHRAFRVRKVEAVWLEGVPRVKMTLDRTSKDVIEKLLKSKVSALTSNDVKIKVTKRISGAITEVIVSDLIPKEAIKAVSDEFRERIRVKKLDENGNVPGEKTKTAAEAKEQAPAAEDLNYDPLA